jgi:glycosyltransferase involved in cell wall biosynthesis
MRKGVSIIICTLNGLERLEQTLFHISKQRNEVNISWELILADNGSRDGSVSFAEACWRSFGPPEIPIQVIVESKPGKLFALQKAISLASYEFLIICDDDNWLNANYLELAYGTLETIPNVAALGGRGIPVTSGTPLPRWFDGYLSAYAVGPQAKQTGFLRPRDLLWGAGLVTRKSLYMEMYENFPSLLLEHENASVLSAEDTEYCMRLILKGYKLYYNESMVYQHFIPDHKLTTGFRDNRLLAGFDEANQILSNYYAAMRVKIKTKNRPDVWLGLLFVSPVNYLFATTQSKKAKARNTLYFLLPFGKAPNPMAAKVKGFLNKLNSEML